MTRKSNLNTLRPQTSWNTSWASDSLTYSKLVLTDNKISVFLSGLFYSLKMPTSYFLIRRFYSDLVLLETDLVIFSFKRHRRFVYTQRLFYIVVSRFRRWLRRYIFNSRRRHKIASFIMNRLKRTRRTKRTKRTNSTKHMTNDSNSTKQTKQTKQAKQTKQIKQTRQTKQTKQTKQAKQTKHTKQAKHTKHTRQTNHTKQAKQTNKTKQTKHTKQAKQAKRNKQAKQTTSISSTKRTNSNSLRRTGHTRRTPSIKSTNTIRRTNRNKRTNNTKRNSSTIRNFGHRRTTFFNRSRRASTKYTRRKRRSIVKYRRKKRFYRYRGKGRRRGRGRRRMHRHKRRRSRYTRIHAKNKLRSRTKFSLRTNILNAKAMLRFLTMQAVSNYYKLSGRRLVMCLLPIIRRIKLYRKSRSKIHCRRRRKKHSLLFKRRGTLFSRSFGKTVLFQVRHAYHLCSRLNTFVPGNQHTSAVLVNKQINRTNRFSAYSSHVKYSNVRHRHSYTNRCYSTLSSTTTRSYRTSKRPPTEEPRYGTIRASTIGHYDSAMLCYLQSEHIFVSFSKFYSMLNNVELSHIDGTYAPEPDNFNPMSGYQDRPVDGTDYDLDSYNDAIAMNRKLYAAMMIKKEEERKQYSELQRCKNKAKEAQLLEDIRSASLRSPRSFLLSAAHTSKMREMLHRMDDKCKGGSSDSGAGKKPMYYLQATVMKAFHDTLRGTYKETNLFYAFLSHESYFVSRVQQRISSLYRLPDKYIPLAVLQFLKYPFTISAYSWLIICLIILLCLCAYIYVDYHSYISLVGKREELKNSFYILNDIFTERLSNYHREIAYVVELRKQKETAEYLRVASYLWGWFWTMNVGLLYEYTPYSPTVNILTYTYHWFYSIFGTARVLVSVYSDYWFHWVGFTFKENLPDHSLLWKQILEIHAELERAGNDLTAVEEAIGKKYNYHEQLPTINAFITEFNISFDSFILFIFCCILFILVVVCYIKSYYFETTTAYYFMQRRVAFGYILVLTYLSCVAFNCLFPHLFNVYIDLLTDSLLSLPSYHKEYVFAQGERSFYEDKVEGPWWVGDQDDINHAWEEEDCYGKHNNPFCRYLVVLPNDETPYHVYELLFVRLKPLHLIFEAGVFVVFMALLPTAYVALYIILYPLVGANFMRRQADLLSREIRDNWSNTLTRHTDPDKVATYIVRTHEEGWKNFVKSCVFVSYFLIFFPQVSFAWIFEEYWHWTRENSALLYLVNDCVFLFCFIFFWCSFIYHSYRYFIYEEVGLVWRVMPVDACHAYRSKLKLLFSVLVFILIGFVLMYSLFFILTFTGPCPSTYFLYAF